jgi:anti-sigma factor RsiW
MTACPDKAMLLEALLDGELDAVHAAEVEAHVAGCAGCRAALEDLTALRLMLRTPGVREPAPERLKARIAATIAPAAAAANDDRPVSTLRRRAPLAAFGGAVGVAACVALALIVTPMLGTGALEDELVAGHVRSLQASHLIDVATSDQHVVKPWFDGKLDFAPPVIDLAPQGFPIVGGRLDYVDHRAVAAVVYKRGRHLINLFIWPQTKAAPAGRHTRDGYTLLDWRQGGMSYWAVSDVNPNDLAAFETLMQARAPR